MTRDVTVPAASATLTFNAWYAIETCWDYACVRVSTDGGATYTNLATNISDAGNENGQNFGNGITGISGQPKHCDEASGTPSWVNATADLSPYAGQTVKLQFRYWTDPFVQGLGFEVDDIAINGTPVGTAESDSQGWTFDGFRRTSGAETSFHNRLAVPGGLHRVSSRKQRHPASCAASMTTRFDAGLRTAFRQSFRKALSEPGPSAVPTALHNGGRLPRKLPKRVVRRLVLALHPRLTANSPHGLRVQGLRRCRERRDRRFSLFG